MTYYNNAVMTKRDLLVRLLKLLAKNELYDKIDRIPIEMRPRTNSPIRCCVHKDRAVIKYKIMAMLGFNVSDEEDELTPLSAYAKAALDKQAFNGQFLTVVDEACSSCVQVNYTVSNLCQGCEGRPCQVNCPKDAITVLNGRANIDHHKCVSCGLCQKACPFHAIAYLPVPCEESCPVKAIKKNGEGRETIDFSKCIHCGKCMTACPFGAIAEKSQVLNLFHQIRNKKQPTVALVAPAVLSQFKARPAQLLQAIKAIGFTDVVEVAQGAALTTMNETHELLERKAANGGFMTTSCCPAFVALTETSVPELRPHVSHTPSPMIYSAQLARERYPDSKLVFIGPCLAKRSEAYKTKAVDYVITTEELGAMWAALKIDATKMPDDYDDASPVSADSRGFAMTGGVTQSIINQLDENTSIKTFVIDGLQKKSIKLLKAFSKKAPDYDLIEVMACEGGCIAGPTNITPDHLSKTAMKAAIEELELSEATI